MVVGASSTSSSVSASEDDDSPSSDDDDDGSGGGVGGLRCFFDFLAIIFCDFFSSSFHTHTFRQNTMIIKIVGIAVLLHAAYAVIKRKNFL